LGELHAAPNPQKQLRSIFFPAKHHSSKNSRSTKSMDLALNSTKSMECLKGYSAKALFVLTRGVGWKLPTFTQHTGSFLFFSSPCDPRPPSTFPLLRRPRPPHVNRGPAPPFPPPVGRQDRRFSSPIDRHCCRPQRRPPLPSPATPQPRVPLLLATP
jgi:hypothetical protein